MKILRNLLQFLLFLGIGSTILFFVYRSQNEAYLNECCIRHNPGWGKDLPAEALKTLIAQCRLDGAAEKAHPSLLEKLWADFKQVRFGWIGLVLLAFVVSNISRTYKWQMLLAPMGYRPRFINGLLSILVGYFANLGLPRMGEVVRAGLLAKYEKIPVEKVMGTIVVDRVTDVLCLGLAFLAALFFESEKILGFLSTQEGGNEAGGGFNWKWAVLAAAAAGALLVFLLRKKLFNTAVFQKAKNRLLGLWEGIQTVRRLERPWLFVLHSLNIWFMFFLMTWLGFQAFGPTEHLGLRAALTVFVFGTLGMVIPSPGGMGTFHALVIYALTTFYAVSSSDAFSAANIIFFSVSIGFNSLLGILGLVLLPFLNSRKI